MQVIVHRTESDWTANGIRLGGERNPIGRRTESDWTANGIRLDGERERWQNERNHSTKQGAVVSVSLCIKLRFSIYKAALEYL